MTLPLSGPINLNMVNVELGKSGTALITLNDTNVRTLAGRPAAGSTIAFDNFYGKSSRANLSVTYSAHTANATININALPGYIAGNTTVNVTVNSGIYVYSNATGGIALNITGGTTGDTIVLVNNGFIMGQGGYGGGSDSGLAIYAPVAGSTAISISRPITITNGAGYIGGGGGGGGGATYGGGGGGAGGGAGGGTSGSGGGAGGGLGASGGNGAANTGGGGGGGRGMPGYGAFGNTMNTAGTYYPGAGGGALGANPGAGGAGGGYAADGSKTGTNGGGGGGGWGAAGGTGGSSDNVTAFGNSGGGAGAGDIGNNISGFSPNMTYYVGAAGGKAINTGGNAVTWVSGSGRAFGVVG
jgi:hypothetical protein